MAPVLLKIGRNRIPPKGESLKALAPNGCGRACVHDADSCLRAFPAHGWSMQT
jgi:hypothetical protein